MHLENSKKKGNLVETKSQANSNIRKELWKIG